MLVMASCLSKVKTAVNPIILPKGTFVGQFAKLHRNITTGKSDTAYANLTLKMDSLGNYAISGDTATVHAGSFGKFGLGVGNDMLFTDKTLPPTGTPAKTHLNGDYLYQYSNGVLEFVKGEGDTISYQYYFTGGK
jgi:hypothetical protein